MPKSSRSGAQRGQVLVLFAIALVTIVAAVGLVIDGGSAYAQRRSEQNAADFAALAGADAMLNGQDPVSAAMASAQVNHYQHGQNGVSVAVSVTPTTVKVDITAPHANYFAGVVGMHTWDVSVTATALTGIPTKFQGIAPFILRQEAFDPGTGLPIVTFTTPVDFTKTQGQNSDYPQLVLNMSWTNLGTGNVSSADVKDALDGTAPINTNLLLNQYIGQNNNGVHNSLFDTNGNQPSVNTTLAGLDVVVPIVGEPITGQTYCYDATGVPDGSNTDGCFQGWALFHVVSASKNGGGGDGTITGYFLTGISRSASVEDVCAISDTSCAGFFHGIYIVKLID